MLVLTLSLSLKNCKTCHAEGDSIVIPGALVHANLCVITFSPYISNQISPIHSSEQQQKSINNSCNILKLMSKTFDQKMWHNFREILVKATFKV